MQFAKELYPTPEEATDATLKNPETTEAVAQFLKFCAIEKTLSKQFVAGANLIERLLYLLTEEERRAKPAEIDDCIGAHIHENKNGTWSIYFDELEQAGPFETRDLCENAFRKWLKGMSA